MIAGRQHATWTQLPLRALTLIVVALLSLVAAAAVLELEAFALGVLLFSAAVLVTLWRPRYGLYTVLIVTVTLEPQRLDPFASAGHYIHSNISTWSSLSFAIFTPVELLLIVTAFAVVAHAAADRRLPRTGQLQWPLLVFLALLSLSVAYGRLTGGNLTIALWETRSLFVCGLVALLVPALLPERGQVGHLLNLLLIAAVLLSLDLIYRRIALVDTGAMGISVEWAFAHESPLMLNLAIILLVARLVWPASARQRVLILLVPLFIYAEMLTERRAGWVSLDIGLLLVMIFIFRLRRKVFFFLVLPLAIVYAGYLAAFWNADGPLAEPARAVRSINDPEGRDSASNLYRLTERLNIRANIRANPLTGLGFGHQYVFYYPLPDLSWWPFWRYIPHNGVLFLWMKMGPLGFIAFLTLCGAALTRGVQLLKRANNDRSAPTLVATISLLLMLVVYSYVDISVNNSRAMVMLGLALGVIGAWGSSAARQEAGR